MTNAEKFEEVFGFEPNDSLCYMPKDIKCPGDDCNSCKYNFWLNEEYGRDENIPTTDCISVQAAIDAADKVIERDTSGNNAVVNAMIAWSAYIKGLPPVTPQQRTGEWQRMSDLPEDEDDRYKCSRCGNVVHFSSKENLYTFSRWCGRCGSNNDRREKNDK